MESPAPLVLRVFLSSPGDVAEERGLALRLLRGLADKPWARGRFMIRPVLWDDSDAPAPMDAGSTPQAAVDAGKGPPADCDLTVVVLWSRIGSPPPLPRDDGRRRAAGTEWEFENALGAGDPQAALVHYRKALFFAFAFQVFPQPADAYTAAFYGEIRGRAAAALLGQPARDPAAAAALAAALRDFRGSWRQRHGGPDAAALREAPAAGDAARLEAAVCPALFAELHLRERETAFAREAESVGEALRVAADVGVAQAPA